VDSRVGHATVHAIATLASSSGSADDDAGSVVNLGDFAVAQGRRSAALSRIKVVGQ